MPEQILYMYNLTETQTSFDPQKLVKKGIFTVRSTLVSKCSTRPVALPTTEILSPPCRVSLHILNPCFFVLHAVSVLQFVHCGFSSTTGGEEEGKILSCLDLQSPLSTKSENSDYFHYQLIFFSWLVDKSRKRQVVIELPKTF